MKKMKMLILMNCIFVISGYAQSEISDVSLRLIPQINDTLHDGLFIVDVTDSSSVSAIEVKLGTRDGLSNLVNYTFNYDVTIGLPSGYSYSRVGSKCTLAIGTVAEINTLFGEVRIYRSDNTWSAPYKFITN